MYNSRDYNHILLNDKDQQVFIVSSAPGRSLLYTIALFLRAFFFLPERHSSCQELLDLVDAVQVVLLHRRLRAGCCE